jgi:hypothetical protein
MHWRYLTNTFFWLGRVSDDPPFCRFFSDPLGSSDPGYETATPSADFFATDGGFLTSIINTASLPESKSSNAADPSQVFTDYT